MERIRIVTDSTADLSPQQVDHYGLEVVPLTVSFGGESFVDGPHFDRADFYRRLAASPEMPQTSQPSPGAFADVYRRLGQAAERIISIHISAHLSGTLNSATAGAAAAGQEVTTVDTKTGSQGTARSALVAAEAVRRGFRYEEVMAVLRESVANTLTVFGVGTLEYLRRNGRIGRAASLLGSVLQVKPIVYCDPDGMVAPYARVRGQAQVLPRLVTAAQERIPAGAAVDVSVVHSGLPDQAERLLAQLADVYRVVGHHLGMVGPVIGSHVGPGCLGLMIQPTFEVLAEMASSRQAAAAV